MRHSFAPIIGAALLPALVLVTSAQAEPPKLPVPAVEERSPKSPRQNVLQIISMTMQPGEELIVGRRLREILNNARKRNVGHA